MSDDNNFLHLILSAWSWFQLICLYKFIKNKIPKIKRQNHSMKSKLSHNFLNLLFINYPHSFFKTS